MSFSEMRAIDLLLSRERERERLKVVYNFVVVSFKYDNKVHNTQPSLR